MSTNIGEIIIKELPDLGVVTNAWQGAYKETGKAMGKVYRAAGRHASGPAFNLYHDGEYREIANVETCLPVKKKLSGSCEYKVLTGATFATTLHLGPYETIGESYAKLFEFINMNEKTSGVPIREVYHKGPGMLLKGNPKKYVTEIQIPI